MKKISVCVAALLTLAVLIHGLDLSAGVGGDITALLDLEHIDDTTTPYATTSGGPALFFDAKYAVFELDLLWGRYRPAYYPYDPNDVSTSVCHFGFGLYAKYPFVFRRFSVYPMLGVKYGLFLYGQHRDHAGGDIGGRLSRGSAIGGGDDAASLFDTLSIAAGCGFDVPLTRKLFMRTEALVNYTFKNGVERERARNASEFHYDYWDAAFGAQVRIAVGWAF